jgi:hypothetical protein
MSKSKFIKFKTTKLTDYLLLKTNRVLKIDDISNNFSSANDDTEVFSNIFTIDPNRGFNRFLVQVVDSTETLHQITEIISINDDTDILNVIKSSITSEGNTDEIFANIEAVSDNFGNMYLQFFPENQFDYDFNIKVLNSAFTTRNAGINTVSLGFIDIFSQSDVVSSASTISFLSVDKDSYTSAFVGINLINQSLNYKNYVELQVVHDGTNTYLNEVYFDDLDGFNGRFLGTFTSYISDNKLIIDYTNSELDNVFIRTKTICFGDTSVGVGTYRFLSEDQPEGTENSLIYDSDFSTGLNFNPVKVFSMNKNTFTSSKSFVKVSNGDVVSLHELMTIHDGNNINVNQFPFLSVGSTTGIGTFGGVYSGSDLIINFYPDSNISGNVEVLSFNEKIYKNIDSDNIPKPLSYTPILEEVKYSSYFGKNSDQLDRKDFNLLYDSKPIFVKRFNPTNQSILNKSTGIFTINDHLFSNLERVIYKPKSTFTGIGESPVGIGATLNSLGIVTDLLPEELYVIKINPDQFRLSTRKDYAEVGIFVTFTSNGQGNAHELEAYEKNSRCIIAVDDIIQYPLLYTSITHTLQNNGGSIGSGSTIFSLSGISTINPRDLLKIDDEYVYVTNVGLGTTSVGPITFSGNLPLVEVERGSVGSSSTTHTDGTDVRVYRGSYNIVGNKLYFTNSPRGNSYFVDPLDFSNLKRSTSKFNGRVFLRSDYSSNKVYDDISEKFTGFDSDYVITSQGINTIGLGTDGGNGLLVLNGIFQSPTTENNSNNNFQIIENETLGITSVSFTGITSSNGEIIKSESDVNQNQLPRGGILVSLGSTSGLGYAPLVGASVTAVINNGSIVAITTNKEFGSYGSGYREPVNISIAETEEYSGTPANINVVVGAGGSLSFNIINGGSGYTSPEIIIPPPSYENLPIVGVSRLGIGETTETGKNLLISVEVGASSTSGIGSTTFSVTNFKITRNGYGFKRGDVFKVVGLVTASGLSEPIEEFQLTVLDTFNDSFALWNFGSFNYIDNIKNYQDGVRTRFPLFYNSQLLTFEKDPEDEDSQLIDTNNLLLIFINGILQIPGESYQFDGGSSFTFTEPPKPEDQISVFFYIGSADQDSFLINIQETIKIGDQIKLFSSNELSSQIPEQELRYVVDLKTSDTAETSLYTGEGIDDVNYRPSQWIKQKRELIINNDIISTVRDSLETQIYPTSRIIKSFNSSQNEIFVESIDLFKYDNENPSVNNFDFIILDDNQVFSTASVEAVVSSAGTIQGLSILDSGNGYTGSSIDIKFSKPEIVGVGIGTTASATLSIVDGKVSEPITIINPGLGYSTSNPPQVILESPRVKIKKAFDASTIQGFERNIISISTTTGIGANLAIKFEFQPGVLFNDLQVGYPIYVSNTRVGSGITSINSNDSDVVGVGTVFVDNIYYVHAFNSTLGIATCNILSTTTNTAGINTFTTNLNFPVGKVTWGKISGFYVDNQSENIVFDVDGYEVSGLSTYPVIQRRGYGLRDTGSIKKLLS